MARKVATLEKRITDFGDDLWHLMPQMYKDRGKVSTDPMNQAWVEAVTSVADAYRAMKELSRLTADKTSALPATGPCPFVTANEHALIQ